jgi:serine/threonine-protein kinase
LVVGSARWQSPAIRNTFYSSSPAGFVTPADSPFSETLRDRYVLERELGRGGMATVYLARDRKHNRRVAIKVLHSELAAVLGTERFVQEIRVIANLQHPHIVGLIDSGIFDRNEGALAGRPYYVMPYVEGESLRQKLEREGQLSVPDTVRIATEVASALDYAHRQRVIHRDVKPENILLHDGSALVADFGIALALQQAGGERMTQTGLSLGTPQYMSPEQAMGERTITLRSDIYALGAVTYEMLAGEPPFTGLTVQAIVARLMAETPRRLTVLRRTVPAHVETAVLQALEKLPADRFASAAEFGAALGSTAYASRPAVSVVRWPVGARAVTWLPWALLLAASGVIAFGMLRPKSVVPPPPVYRFDVVLPENAAWVGDVFSVMALSPDGTTLVYNGQDSTGQRRLYLRAMDRLEPVPIPGSENGAAPFFSPDGRSIGFRLGTRLVKATVSGGTPEAVCEAGGLVRATWLERNVMVFSDRLGLRQCSMSGQLTTLLASKAGESFTLPHGLPGDRGVLFSIQRDSTSRLAVLDFRGNTIKQLNIAGGDPRYVATGHLVYSSPDGLVRVIGFDAKTMSTAGEPVVLDAGIRIELGGAVMALSRTGTIVTPAAAAQRRLELVDRSGRAEPLSSRPGEFADPSISPDGRRIAVRLGHDIWVLDRAQGASTRLSFDSSASRPAWSADGRHVAYIRQIGTDLNLRLLGADGSAPAESLLALPDLEIWEALFTPDDRSLIVRTVGGLGSRDIWLVPLDSVRRPVPLLNSRADEVAPAISPDGRSLAYVSNESGRAEVYVRSFPDMGGRYQISLDGGTEPAWSPRGGELFYRNGPAMMAARLRAGVAVEVSHRSTLFSDPDYVTDLTHRVYDVMPDGEHFVLVRNLAGASHLTVTLNRFHNLHR